MAAEGALVSVPLFNAMFLLNTTSLSAVFFGSLDSLSAIQTVLFMFGCMCVMSGVCLVLKRPTKPEEPEMKAKVVDGACPESTSVWFESLSLGSYTNDLNKAMIAVRHLSTPLITPTGNECQCPWRCQLGVNSDSQSE